VAVFEDRRALIIGVSPKYPLEEGKTRCESNEILLDFDGLWQGV
jgi:hypothetical protein